MTNGWRDKLSSSLPRVLVGAIAEVEFKGGSAHATASHPAPWTADKAFIPGHANAWHNGYDTLFPHYVWYEFPADKAFVPARVSFRPRQVRGTIVKIK